MKTRPLSWFALLLAVIATVSLPHGAFGQTTGGPYKLFMVRPCRLVDTRTSMGATQLMGSATQNITVKGACGVPMTAKVAVINLIAVSPSESGNVTAWAAGTAFPPTTTLVVNTGETAVGNGTIVSLGSSTPDLSVVFGTATGMGSCHLVIDVVGYFQ